MKKFYSLIMLLIGFLFLGCVGNSQPQVKKITHEPFNKKVVLNINFPEIDPVTNKKTNIDIKKIDLSSKMLKYSSYHPFRVIARDTGSEIYSGLQITKKQNYYDLEYKDGFYQYDLPSGWYVDTVEFKIPYKVENKKIIFTYPSEYEYIPCQGLVTLCIGAHLLDDFDKLEADVNRIFTKIPNIKLYINKLYILKGEENTPYNSSSIYANFERLLGKYNHWNNKHISNLNIKKEDTFALTVNGKVYPVEVTVYPYKNGSKVIYKAYFNYFLTSDGKSSLTKSDIEKAKEKIKKVIND
jgi:hypothetical protein